MTGHARSPLGRILAARGPGTRTGEVNGAAEDDHQHRIFTHYDEAILG